MSDKVISSTTQEFLDVYDIVNDMVLLKDGTAAVILQIGTMNFSLLAEQEQDAVIFTYGSLLNSLNYPIQINIQSQTKDATKYLRLLDEQIKKASSDRKAILIRQYRDFVATLIRERNVLQKRFYIVVPASPGEMGLITPAGVLPGKTTFDITSVEKSILLEKATNLLEPRRDHLTAQFNRLGLFAKQLSTQEIIQNFYINYNPEAAEGQEISSSENYTTPLVRASFGGKFMQLNQQQDDTQPVQNNQPANSSSQASTQTPVAPVSTASPPTPASETAPMIANAPQEQVAPVEASISPSPEEILGVANTSQGLEQTQAQVQTFQAPTPEPAPEPIQETFVQTPVVETNSPSAADQVIFQNQTVPAQGLAVTPEPTLAPEPTEDAAQQFPEVQLGTQLPDLNQEVAINQTPVEQVLDPAQESAPIPSAAPALTPEPTATPETTPFENSGVGSMEDSFSEDITPLQNKFEVRDQEKTS